VAEGTYVLTLDANLSRDPDFIVKLWAARRSDRITLRRATREGRRRHGKRNPGSTTSFAGCTLNCSHAIRGNPITGHAIA
jgi:hypothetical protein